MFPQRYLPPFEPPAPTGPPVVDLRKWEAAGEIAVAAEAFVVDVLPQFPEEGNALDLGDVRVGATVEKTFQVVNNGMLGAKKKHGAFGAFG